MKLKDVNKSIQYRMFLTLCITTIIGIFVIILINSLVLEGFYTYTKIRTAKDITKSINEYYQSSVQYNIDMQLREIEIKENIQILILSEDGNVVYMGNKDIMNFVNKNIKMYGKSILKENNTEIWTDGEKLQSNNVFLKSNLSNEYTLYIKIPVIPIRESVKISNRVLFLISIMMIVISGIASSIISRRFTQPILKLNNITKKMTRLDFSEKYRIVDTDDEINTLGKNINQLSDKLETTIELLRHNNDQLEKDIEKKSKIDEMRKQFISDVSHELKTPISLIEGYSEGLIENVNTDEESRKFYAEVIMDEAKKMDNIVKELLELMKIEYQQLPLNDTKFNLTDLIQEEIKRQTVILQDKKITVEFDEKNIQVYADYKSIERVINNYLTNAIKHCEEKKKEKKIIIRYEKTENNKIRLYIYNTGEKIPEENINKIWQRFYKEDLSRNRGDGGTGIGLAVVKAIMNNYKNEYGVKNYDNGVEFYCDINCVPQKQIINKKDKV